MPLTPMSLFGVDMFTSSFICRVGFLKHGGRLVILKNLNSLAWSIFPNLAKRETLRAWLMLSRTLYQQTAKANV